MKWNQNEIKRESSGVIAKVLDCSLKVSEFELQLHYYVHFRTNTLSCQQWVK